jgi:hypothetical protein
MMWFRHYILWFPPSQRVCAGQSGLPQSNHTRATDCTTNEGVRMTVATGNRLAATLDGKTYHRQSGHWYDTSTNLRVPTAIGSQLNMLVGEAECRRADLEELRALHEPSVRPSPPQALGPVDLEELRARHRRHVEARGMPYKGAGRRQRVHTVRRETHCWGCKAHLDSDIEIECFSCGWILCRCGCCGCGWHRMY